MTSVTKLDYDLRKTRLDMNTYALYILQGVNVRYGR